MQSISPNEQKGGRELWVLVRPLVFVGQAGSRQHLGLHVVGGDRVGGAGQADAVVAGATEGALAVVGSAGGQGRDQVAADSRDGHPAHAVPFFEFPVASAGGEGGRAVVLDGGLDHAAGLDRRRDFEVGVGQGEHNKVVEVVALIRNRVAGGDVSLVVACGE